MNKYAFLFIIFYAFPLAYGQQVLYRFEKIAESGKSLTISIYEGYSIEIDSKGYCDIGMEAGHYNKENDTIKVLALTKDYECFLSDSTIIVLGDSSAHYIDKGRNIELNKTWDYNQYLEEQRKLNGLVRFIPYERDLCAEEVLEVESYSYFGLSKGYRIDSDNQIWAKCDYPDSCISEIWLHPDSTYFWMLYSQYDDLYLPIPIQLKPNQTNSDTITQPEIKFGFLMSKKKSYITGKLNFKNQLYEEYMFICDTVNRGEHMEYYSNGNLMIYSNFGEKGLEDSVVIYYNESNRPKLRILMDEKGQVIKKEEFLFRTEGLSIVSIDYNDKSYNWHYNDGTQFKSKINDGSSYYFDVPQKAYEIKGKTGISYDRKGFVEGVTTFKRNRSERFKDKFIGKYKYHNTKYYLDGDDTTKVIRFGSNRSLIDVRSVAFGYHQNIRMLQDIVWMEDGKEKIKIESNPIPYGKGHYLRVDVYEMINNKWKLIGYRGAYTIGKTIEKYNQKFGCVD